MQVIYIHLKVRIRIENNKNDIKRIINKLDRITEALSVFDTIARKHSEEREKLNAEERELRLKLQEFDEKK